MTGPRAKSGEKPWSDAILLGGPNDGSRGRAIRFSFLLLVFMRIVACLWIFRGLVRWLDILGPGPEPFAAATSAAVAQTMFFCVADFVSGVGLWMGAPWGGVLWLFTGAIGLIATLAASNPTLAQHIAFGGDLALIVAYFVLSWYAARERDE